MMPNKPSAEERKPKCPACNSVYMSHCSDPENCGGVYWPDHMYRHLEQALRESREESCKHQEMGITMSGQIGRYQVEIANLHKQVAELSKPVTGRWHNLKTWPEFFRAICAGTKRFELRVNDRDFKAGDGLHLLEWNPDTKTFSGLFQEVRVDYISQGIFGLPADVCIMSISKIALPPTQSQPTGGQQMSELKPCPFQHTKDIPLSLGLAIVDKIAVCVECGCGAQGPPYTTEEEAIAAWNHRTSQPEEPINTKPLTGGVKG